MLINVLIRISFYSIIYKMNTVKTAISIIVLPNIIVAEINP